MTDILQSETFIFCKDIEIVCRSKIPECQVNIGILKVTVQLGSEQRNFGNNFVNKLNNESLCNEAGSDHDSVKPVAFKHECEASLKPVLDSRRAPRHHISNISRGTVKNSRRSAVNHNINNKYEFCKNCEEVELDHRVADSSLSETNLNEVRLALSCSC
jgi:ribosomal protein L32